MVNVILRSLKNYIEQSEENEKTIERGTYDT